MPVSLRAVKWILLSGCIACAPSVGTNSRPATPSPGFGEGRPNGMGDALSHWKKPEIPNTFAGPVLPERVVPTAVGATILRGAEIDMERGAALTERMSSFSRAEQQQWSVGLLTMEELFGDEENPGLCEFPAIHSTLREKDGNYDVKLLVYSYTAFLGDPEPMWVSISADCVAGIQATAGDIQAAVDAGSCADDEAHTFFADGSDCRRCVEGNGGEYGGCSASCPEQVPLAVWAEGESGEKRWYRGVAATGWACAPDYLTPFYLLAEYGEDGALPASYDHDSWAYLCTPFADPQTGEPTVTCNGSEEPGRRGVLAEGLFGYVASLAPSGDSTLAWRGRQYYVDAMNFSNGAEISWFWAYGGGLAALSAPRVIEDNNGNGQEDAGDLDYGFGSGGFGLNPHHARPDGEILARDWLATAQLKTSTTRNGVPIFVYQRSLCEAWSEEATDGSRRCTSMAAPEGGWLNDAYTEALADSVVQYPLATLASTGQIDPDVPGGLVVQVAGSTTLARPGWEDCSLPHQFVPDVVPFADRPGDWEGDASLLGQSWSFEKEDYRMVLNTNQARGWCGGNAEGGGRSVVDALE